MYVLFGELSSGNPHPQCKYYWEISNCYNHFLRFSDFPDFYGKVFLINFKFSQLYFSAIFRESNVYKSISFVTTQWDYNGYTRFFVYKQHFYKQHQAETGKNSKKPKQHLEAELLLFESYSIIYFLHPCYHQKLVSDLMRLFDWYNENEDVNEN